MELIQALHITDDNKIAQEIAAVKSDELPIIEMFYGIEGEGSMVGDPRILLRLGGCRVACHGCFPSQYKINTATGKKSLHDVQVGDELFTFDAHGALTLTTVVDTLHYKSPMADMRVVEFDWDDGSHGSIKSTFNHPYNVKGRGWIAADDLRVGDVIYHANGNELTAFAKTVNNPMRRTDVAARMRSTKAAIGFKPFGNSKEQRDRSAKRMREQNPMFNADSRKRMTLNKTYKKSALEKAVDHLFTQRDEYDFDYVGDNSFPIGDDTVGYMFPDFVWGNFVIETYDTSYPFYVPDRSTPASRKRYEKARTVHYAKFGYKVLFITQVDVPDYADRNGKFTRKNLNGRANDAALNQALYERVNDFLHNGVTVTQVRELNVKEAASIQREYDQRTSAQDDVSVSNFKCAPHNSYIINGLHVHNCDTPHSWGLKSSTVLPLKVILKALDEMIDQHKVHRVAITGGEPMHYPAQLIQIAEHLRRRGVQSWLETSGLFLDVNVFKAFDFISFDVKTPSSGPACFTDDGAARFAEFLVNHQGQFLGHVKAIVTGQTDIDWIKDHFKGWLRDGFPISDLPRQYTSAVLYHRTPLYVTPACGKKSTPDQVRDRILLAQHQFEGFAVRIIAQQHAILQMP